MVPMVRGSWGKILKNRGILHSEVMEKYESQGKSGKIKVPGCKS